MEPSEWRRKRKRRERERERERGKEPSNEITVTHPCLPPDREDYSLARHQRAD